MEDGRRQNEAGLNGFFLCLIGTDFQMAKSLHPIHISKYNPMPQVNKCLMFSRYFYSVYFRQLFP